MYICYQNYYDGHDVTKNVVMLVKSQKLALDWCDDFDPEFISSDDPDPIEWRSFKKAEFNENIEYADDDYKNDEEK